MIDYIFIAGDARSGSTFTEQLLSNHPDIEGMGELQKLSLQFDRDGIWSNHAGLCGCGVRISDCPVWAGIASDIAGEYGVDIIAHPYSFRISDVGRELDLGAKALRHYLFHYGYRSISYARLQLSATLDRKIDGRTKPRFGERRLFVAERFAQRVGIKAVADNSKDCASMIDLYRATEGRLKILWLTRDVRAIAASKARLWSRDMVDSARLWRRINVRIRRALSCFERDSWLQIKYEDLCQDTQSTCRRICDFLGYDHTDEMCALKAVIHHTIGGDSVRLRGVRKVIPALDKWRKVIDPDQEERIWNVAGAFAESVGYTKESLP